MTTLGFDAAARVPDDASMLAVPVFAGCVEPPASTIDLDVSFLQGAGFEGKVGQVQCAPQGGRTVAFVGMGPPDQVTAETFRRAAAATVQTAWRTPAVVTTLLDALPPDGVDGEQAAQAIAEGAGMAAYEFTAYKSDLTLRRLEHVTVVVERAYVGGVTEALRRGALVAEAVCLARSVVNEPPGALTPVRLAEVAVEVAGRAGLSVTVLDEDDIAEAGLGGLAGVALGSHQPARLIELAYEPPGEAVATVALVGKGITFDSGGLSIKTAEPMMTMKTDMSGAAAVLAAMSALADLGARVRVLGFLPVAENMPGGAAIKPGDVVRIRNGTTVEVLNTDAEGRLVLADALCLAAERRPDAIVDVATLTGAQVVALGSRIAALLGNDEVLVDQVRAAAARAGESVWPLPLPSEYRADIDSEIADLKNIGQPGKAGTLVAGLFLQEFVGEVPWAHLDIAGPARSDKDDGYVKKGGTGFGVRTLIELVLAFEPPRPAPAAAPPQAMVATTSR